MKTKIIYKPKFNFHAARPINLILSDWQPDAEIQRITPAQSRRISDHYCGVSGCSCGSAGIIDITGNDDDAIYTNYCEVQS